MVLSPVVVAVVLHSQDASVYASKHVRNVGRSTASSIGMDRLRLGLTELAYHFGILDCPPD